MARIRLRPEPHGQQADGTAVPPQLGERCWVEDWIDPAEVIDPDELLIVARRRWRDEGVRWLREHGIDSAQGRRLIPHRTPRFRDAAPHPGRSR